MVFDTRGIIGCAALWLIAFIILDDIVAIANSYNPIVCTHNDAMVVIIELL